MIRLMLIVPDKFSRLSFENAGILVTSAESLLPNKLKSRVLGSEQQCLVRRDDIVLLPKILV